MSLVPVKKRQSVGASERESVSAVEATNASRSNAPDAPALFTVPIERQHQIGVTYAKVTKQHFEHSIRAVGLVESDAQRRWDYVTRVDGFVEKLFVFSPGEEVETGAPLLTIYSPDLLTTENEFLDVLKTHDEMMGKGDRVVLESSEHLVNAARQRLRLWNITEQQIAELEKTRKPQETITLQSPFKGVVQDLGVTQGRRVAVGDRLLSIADLSVLWVWAQFYEDEMSMLKKGLPVTISTSAYPGEKFSGKISLIDPFLDNASRTARVRIDVDNTAMKLHPQMYVDVELWMDMGEGLAVPVSAMLPTGTRNIVFLDKGEGKLEPRLVKLGRRYGEFYEILSGLNGGERVVTSANFLIDAEAKVQGAVGAW
jgi:Cu(I)/Ag(I) efflux system membrane fusion protein